MATVPPLSRLNLRRNPFGEPPPEEVAGLIVAPIAELADWLRSPQRRALQILGLAGRGKSAHLRALRPALGEPPYVYLAEDEPAPAIAPTPVLLLDEAQRLPRRRRRQLFGTVRTLAIASHEDLAPEMQAAGLEVRTMTAGGLDVERLTTILRLRFEWARRGPGPLPIPDARETAELAVRFGDDLRRLFDHLYEHVQDRALDAGNDEGA